MAAEKITKEIWQEKLQPRAEAAAQDMISVLQANANDEWDLEMQLNYIAAAVAAVIGATIHRRQPRVAGQVVMSIVKTSTAGRDDLHVAGGDKPMSQKEFKKFVHKHKKKGTAL